MMPCLNCYMWCVTVLTLLWLVILQICISILKVQSTLVFYRNYLNYLVVYHIMSDLTLCNWTVQLFLEETVTNPHFLIWLTIYFNLMKSRFYVFVEALLLSIKISFMMKLTLVRKVQRVPPKMFSGITNGTHTTVWEPLVSVWALSMTCYMADKSYKFDWLFNFRLASQSLLPQRIVTRTVTSFHGGCPSCSNYPHLRWIITGHH